MADIGKQPMPIQVHWRCILVDNEVCFKKNKALVSQKRPGFDPWVGTIPWRKEGLLPSPVFWPREFHGLYSPWGHKESETTERLPLSAFK